MKNSSLSSKRINKYWNRDNLCLINIIKDNKIRRYINKLNETLKGCEIEMCRECYADKKSIVVSMNWKVKKEGFYIKFL